MLILGFVLSVPILYFKFPIGVLQWLRSTILNTSHGTDDSAINLQSWLSYSLNDYLSIPPGMILLIVILNTICFACLAQIMINKLRKIETFSERCKFITGHSKSSVLLVCSLASILPVYLSVNRLWGHYLHVGTVFLIIAFFNCYESLLSQRFARSIVSKVSRFCVATVIAIQLPLMFIHLVPSMATDMNKMANRTSTQEYKIKKDEYMFITKLLSQNITKHKPPLKIHIDANIFIPSDNDQINVTEIFGLYKQWDAGVKYIFKYRSDFPFGETPKTTSIMYASWVTEKEIFMQHLSKNGEACSLKPCYEEITTPHSQLVVLSRID